MIFFFSCKEDCRPNKFGNFCKSDFKLKQKNRVLKVQRTFNCGTSSIKI